MNGQDKQTAGVQIGKSLRAIRNARNLTLEQTAALTGVSKPMLSQIERGQSTPTVTTLWNIASGLKVPFSSFLHADQPRVQIVRQTDRPQIEEEDGAMRVWSQFPYDPIRSMELFRIELDAGCFHPSSPHGENVEETILVEQGVFELTVNEQILRLEQGDSARFQAGCPHSYRNPGEELCRISDLIFYGV